MTATRSETAEAVADPAPLNRGLRWLCLIGGLVGLIASGALTIEKIASLNNPNYIPSCSLNPIVSCGSVMDSPQASLFGFTNTLIGVAAFPVVVTVGVVLLAGFHAPRWFWLGLQLGTTFGVIFVHWLMYQSLYEIGALCPYCMVVWAVTIPLFWYTTLHNLERGRLGAGGRSAGATLAKYHSFVLVLWYLAIVGLILQAFWSYWSSLV